MKSTKTSYTQCKTNPYVTNKAGFIKAPNSPSASDPKVRRIDGKADLRGGRG